MESGNNSSTESFYSHVDIYPEMYTTEMELKLISFTSELHKSHDEYLNIDYDHKSTLHIDNSLNTNDCGNARRPLVLGIDMILVEFKSCIILSQKYIIIVRRPSIFTLQKQNIGTDK
jgi:hypothetical protein